MSITIFIKRKTRAGKDHAYRMLLSFKKLGTSIIIFFTSRGTTASVIKQLSLDITYFFAEHCSLFGANTQAWLFIQYLVLHKDCCISRSFWRIKQSNNWYFSFWSYLDLIHLTTQSLRLIGPCIIENSSFTIRPNHFLLFNLLQVSRFH